MLVAEARIRSVPFVRLRLRTFGNTMQGGLMYSHSLAGPLSTT